VDDAGSARSALGVADEGADDALLAAVAVALLQRGVLRLAEPRGGGEAVGAAEVAAVDREGGAIALHRRDHLAVRAGAFLERSLARPLLAREVIGKAVGAAVADRQCAGGLRCGRRKRKARHEQRGS